MTNAAENSEAGSVFPVKMNEGIAEAAPAYVAPQRLNEDPELLAKIFESMTRQGVDAFRDTPLISVRTVTFTVDGSQCAPNVFVDAEGNYYDFKLTMRALTPEQELKVLEGVTSGNQVGQLMAKEMVHHMNGKALTLEQRRWLWMALDMRGRQLCFMGYQQLAGVSASALGKYQASFTIG